MPRESMDRVWKALADPSRRRLLDLLRDGPKTTGELCDAFGMSRFGVMKHLGVLARAKLVLVRRSGRERWNFLNPAPIRRMYERWVRPYEAMWSGGLLRLADHVEQGLEREKMAKKASSKLTSNRTAPSRSVSRKNPPAKSVSKTPSSSTSVKALNPQTRADFGVAHVEMEVMIQAPVARVWTAFIRETTHWWPAEFYSGAQTKGFHIEPKLGGRVYEDWGGDNGLVWGNVVGLDAPNSLSAVGCLFPAWGGPAMYILQFTFTSSGKGTILKVSDTSFGRLADGKLASTRDGWVFLIEKGLKRYVESRGPQPNTP